MKKIIPLILMSATSVFAGNASISIPGNNTQGSYIAINGSNNKAVAAVSGDTTSFKKGFHMGSSGVAIRELDVEIQKDFIFSTGFFYNTASSARSVADGAIINIGNRVVDGVRVFDEGTLLATGGSNASELWFRGEDRAKNAVWHLGTQNELAMGGVRVNVEACNTVYLYNVSFRKNTQVNVDATSELYMSFVDGNNSNETRFGSSNLNGKFRFSMTRQKNGYATIASTATMNIDGQKAGADNYSTFGNDQSKWLIEANAKVNVTNSEAHSILLGTKNSGIITITQKGQLSLSSSNALAANQNNGQDAITLEISTSANSYANGTKLILNADAEGNKTTNSFAGVWLRGGASSGSNLIITLNDNELILGDINDGGTGYIGNIYITDFVEGVFKINTINEKYLDENNKVSFLRAGTDTDYTDLYWNAETKYITAIAVPEPAEWALIFGAIALGFIAYRRRK